MKYSIILLLVFFYHIVYSQNAALPVETSFVKDEAFWQEYHEAYPVGKTSEENEVRSIAVDNKSTVWIAGAAGIFLKKKDEKVWNSPFINDADKGPAYAVAADNQSSVWMGTWKGVFLFKNNTLNNIPGTIGPVSVICIAREGVYALGPNGVWRYDGTKFVKKEYPIARSVRSAISDGEHGIWVATDVGLYHCNSKETKYFYQTNVLISAYVKGLAFDMQGKLWAGGLGGVSILQKEKRDRVITPKEGCPSMYVNCVKRSLKG